LFKEKEQAEGDRLRLAAKEKIDGESEGHEQLQERAARDHDEFAAKTEKQVASFMDGNEDTVHQEQESRAACALVEEERVKNYPNYESCARDGLPGLFELFEDWQSLDP
jgi:hypothetical protein